MDPTAASARATRLTRVRRVQWCLVAALGVTLLDLVANAVVAAEVAPAGRTWFLPGLLGVSRYAPAHAAGVTDYVVVGAILPLAIWAEVLGGWLVTARLRGAVTIAAGASLGGALANSLERIHHGFVTDWLVINLPGGHWIAMNPADAGILVGGTVLALVGLGTAVARLGDGEPTALSPAAASPGS